MKQPLLKQHVCYNLNLKQIIYLTTILLAGCSSSSRFTSDKDSHTNAPGRTSTEELTIKESPSEYSEKYANAPALESEIGIASFYADKFIGRKTANGEIYDQDKFTAAHLNYPFNTIIRVTNILNNKSVIVRVNDRRPDFNGRICDLSKKAASVLNMVKKGITKVRLEVLEWGEPLK